MKKYDSYKNSGIEWIGEIPKHWEITKFGYQVYIKRGVGYQYIEQTEGDDFEPVIRISDFNSFYPLKAKKRSELNNYRVYSGDILIAGTGATAGISIKVESDMDSMVHSYNALRLVSKGESNNSYIFYCLNSHLVEEQKKLAFTGSAQPFLDVQRIANLEFVIPPIKEQTVIANYLDHKTTQIDHLIAKKEQFIQLLEEERVAVINQAVTKGLDPTVPVKDSGIEWLGEVPAHWKVKKLKYVCSVISNKAKTKPNFVLALENIESWTGEIVGDPYSNSMEGEVQLFLKDDILFNKLRPYLAKVCMAKQEGGAIGELLVLRPYKIINSGFLYQRLRSEMIITIVDGSTYGTKMPRASWDKFISQLKIGIPPIDEQHLIEKYIIKNEIRISELALKTKQEIELLKEYKTALISDVVTGKVDVRNEKLN
jgi:type I restriction enzyme S subunit/DNA-damage-inducible protein D